MKKENVITVYVAHPDKGTHYTVEIMNTLEAFQSKVNGYIEVVYIPEFSERFIILIVNEEGLLKGLDYNENLYPYFYVGTVVFASMGKDGKFESLDERQIAFIKTFCDEVGE